MANINFLNTDDCNAITFETPTTDLQFIDYVLGDPSKDYTNVEKYTITTSNNCCSPGIVTDIFTPNQLSPEIIACVSEPAGFIPTPSGVYTIKVNGIDGNDITEVRWVPGAAGYASVWPFVLSYTVDQDGFINVEIVQGDTVATITHGLRLTTTSGLEYIVQFVLTQDPDPGASCDGVISNIENFPPLNNDYLPDNIVEVNDAVAAWISTTPAIGFAFRIEADNKGTIGNGITITSDGVSTLQQLVDAYNLANPNNTVTLTGNSGSYIPNLLEGPWILANGVDYTYRHLSFNALFGFTDIPVPAGIYEIIFCEHYFDGSSTCIQNHVFIDCDGSLKCKVVNKWIMCVDSDINDVYQALLWANECTDTVTYTEFCALYEILTILLETDGCYGRLDDCNCTDATTMANKLSPVRYPKPTNTNPCKTC